MVISLPLRSLPSAGSQQGGVGGRLLDRTSAKNIPRGEAVAFAIEIDDEGLAKLSCFFPSGNVHCYSHGLAGRHTVSDEMRHALLEHPFRSCRNPDRAESHGSVRTSTSLHVPVPSQAEVATEAAATAIRVVAAPRPLAVRSRHSVAGLERLRRKLHDRHAFGGHDAFSSARVDAVVEDALQATGYSSIAGIQLASSNNWQIESTGDLIRDSGDRRTVDEFRWHLRLDQHAFKQRQVPWRLNPVDCPHSTVAKPQSAEDCGVEGTESAQRLVADSCSATFHLQRDFESPHTLGSRIDSPQPLLCRTATRRPDGPTVRDGWRERADQRHQLDRLARYFINTHQGRRVLADSPKATRGSRQSLRKGELIRLTSRVVLGIDPNNAPDSCERPQRASFVAANHRGDDSTSMEETTLG